MKSMRALVLLALAVPLVAAAQVSYPQTYSRDPVCADRNADLWQRKDRLDGWQRDIDREAAELDRVKARLDAEYRNLDLRDRTRVAAYNARSDEYNRRSDEHNRRVQRMNGMASNLNADSEDLATRCDGIVLMR